MPGRTSSGSGTVTIDPGDRLDLDIDLHLRVLDIETASWVFSFNPGLRLTELRHGEEAIPFVHESGLLTIEAGQSMDGAFVLSLRAHGVPDPDFGYLDSTVDWRRRPGTNLLKYLGSEASVFHRNYVALMPAVHWLPTSGSNVDREDPSRGHADFFHLDLVVDVPSGWSVAGPGRQPVAEGAPGNHRLRTRAPIQEVGNALEGVVLGTAGVQKAGALLGELRRRHEGRSFTLEDLLSVADEIAPGLAGVVGEALHEPGLPGFLASPATVVRLSDDDAGRPRYHVTLHVHNGEPVVGWLQLAQYDMLWGEGEPIRVPGKSTIEIGKVYDAPPDQLWLHPYLSLNRREIRLDLVDSTSRPLPGGDGFVGTRPSTWSPPEVDGVVVDDLDAGFSWESAPTGTARWSLIDHYRGWTATLDHGLPVRASEAGAWIRGNVPSAWGKYRRTVAMAAPRGADYRVFFAADIAGGRWRLDYYLPERHIPERWAGDGERMMYAPLGSMEMKLVAFGENGVPGTSPTPLREWSLDFDAALGETGWNKLGEFDIPGGQTRLEVSNVTNGTVVIADAIRWRRVD